MSTQSTQWTAAQKNVVIASFLGWTLDAFDFFLMIFVMADIVTEFHTTMEKTAMAITLTLAMRPVGALIFGRLADRYGRRPVLMIDIALYSLLEFLSAFSPNITVLLILRALFGVAMGGEWGIGSALTIESIPEKSRGWVSGLLQSGYSTGYLLASIVFGLFYQSIGWRGLFMLGVIPALLVLYIRRNVPESPMWHEAHQQPKQPFHLVLMQHWKLALFTILLMTAFNFFSHGSQDLYPTFLEVQHKFDVRTVSMIAITYNIGAILGTITFGTISESIGRRKAILTAALLSLLVLPFWALSTTWLALIVSAFFMQFLVQGAWGVIPVYLNELSPPDIRATFPGLMYQLGNFLASVNAPLQVLIAMYFAGHYSYALMMVEGSAAFLIAVLMLLSYRFAFVANRLKSQV
jgi:SHS family lactate transporter-like MFS transporter